MRKSLEQIAGEDGRFGVGALRFVYEGFGYTIKKVVSEPRHVSDKVLCEGMRQLALERWGRLAMLVLNSWGVRTTQDFGEIVYCLIMHKWMSAQPTDSIDDFNDAYDFKTAFKDHFEF